MVLRGGFGITNDPYSLARPMRTNHPILLNLTVQAPNSFSWAGRTADGVPPIAESGPRQRDHPDSANVTAFTLPDEFNRGYIKSWNVAVQKELEWGFVGEAAYVGTRQIDQLGVLELNWSPIGGGQAGRQLNQRSAAPRRRGSSRPSATPTTTRCRRGSIDASPTGSSSASATRCRSRRASPARRDSDGTPGSRSRSSTT